MRSREKLTLYLGSIKQNFTLKGGSDMDLKPHNEED
jgi:hypothetical protein